MEEETSASMEVDSESPSSIPPPSDPPSSETPPPPSDATPSSSSPTEPPPPTEVQMLDPTAEPPAPAIPPPPTTFQQFLDVVSEGKKDKEKEEEAEIEKETEKGKEKEEEEEGESEKKEEGLVEPEGVRKILDKIEKNSWDKDAWISLMIAVQKLDISQCRPYYERFLKKFPTSGRFWMTYAQEEIKAKNYTNVEHIFRRSLQDSCSLELWSLYLEYQKKYKAKDLDGDEQVTAIINAYEAALEHVGQDINAGSLWSDYITYVGEAFAEKGTSAKIVALRNVYQKAVVIPMHDVAKLWKQYETFEYETNATLAKERMIVKMNPLFQAARTVYMERKQHYEGLSCYVLPVPPVTGSLNLESQIKQFELWRKLIKFEKDNGQNLSKEDLVKRVSYTYNLSFLSLRFFPEIWYDAAMFQVEQGSVEHAVRLFEDGIAANPDSLLLQLAFASFYEERGMDDQATKQYESILTKCTDQEDSPESLSLVYIQYIFFARRAHGVKAAREIFKRARKNQLITHHVFVAAALMEYRVSKDANIARKIFEYGLKKFIDTPNYILKYLELLDHLNKDNNIRVLFERVLSRGNERLSGLQSDESDESEESREVIRQTIQEQSEIWKQFMEFEFSVGDISAINKLEKRKDDMINVKSPGLLRIINRLRFDDLWPCNQVELQVAHIETQSNEEKRATKSARSNKYELPSVSKPSNVDLSKIFRPNLSMLIPYEREMDNQVNPAPPPYPPSGPPRFLNMEGVPQHTSDPTFDALPPSFMELLSSLPSSEAYTWGSGPVVDVDALVKMISECTLPKVPTATPLSGTKRKFSDIDNFGMDELTGIASHPPPNDVFRNRQAQKLAAQNERG